MPTNLSYLTPTDRHWIVDIEADGLLDEATQIWCACLINCVTREEVYFLNAEDFRAWQATHPEAWYVGHNALSYDIVMLNRHWGARISTPVTADTYVLSQMYNPSYHKPPGCRKGPHSLEAWGLRLRYPKGDFDDFSCYSETMLKYCRRDARLTALLFLRLTERMRSVGFTELGCEIEHAAWSIIQNKQKKHGFPLNKQGAEELLATLRHREEELKDDIYKLFPPKLEVVGEYKRPFKKDGSRSSQFERHLEQYPRVETFCSTVEQGGSGVSHDGYRVYDWVSFNLGSPPQRIEKLLSLGWEPVNYNVSKKTRQKTSPKVDEDELLLFAETSGNPEVGQLAKWIVINSRANMINTWLNAYNETTGCVHGTLNIASTLRYKHSNPNSANIPAARVKKVDGHDVILKGEEGAYTYESRDLWTCGDPSLFSLVGIDGKGIQLRCLAHNVSKMVGVEAAQPFIDNVLAGDPHTNNIKTLGLANKAAAKKFLYTTLMGGGGAKLAVDQAQFGTKLSAKDGTVLKDMLIGSIPGFKELISYLEDQLDRTGRITLCDGTPILVPSPHMVIPYLLQGDESRLMKRSMYYVDQLIRAERWMNDIFKVADIHDEMQYKVRNENVDAFIDKSLPCFLRAGSDFGYLVPIEGDAKVGKTWAETH